MELIIKCKNNKDIKFPYTEKQKNYKISEFFNNLLVDLNSKDITNNNTIYIELKSIDYNTLDKFIYFCNLCDFTTDLIFKPEENISIFSKSLNCKNKQCTYNNHSRLICKSIFKKYPLLQNFYNNELNSFGKVEEYFIVADFLRVKLLDQLIVLKCKDLGMLLNGNDKELVNDKPNLYLYNLKRKYIDLCCIDNLSIEDMNFLIKLN